MKIIYTDSAKVELERFHKERQDQLESLIKQRNMFLVMTLSRLPPLIYERQKKGSIFEKNVLLAYLW